MKVFIIGATGYIGQVVAEQVLHAGHEVVALARSDEAVAKLPTGAVTVVRGDLSDDGALQQGLAQADAVIHLAVQGNHGPSPIDGQVIETVTTTLADTNLPVDRGAGRGDRDHPRDLGGRQGGRVAAERAGSVTEGSTPVRHESMSTKRA